MTKPRPVAAVCAALILLFSLSACRKNAAPTESDGFGMGSFFSVKVYGGDEGLGREILTDAGRLESLISVTRTDSDLSRLIENGTGTPDKETAALLKRSVDLGKETGGALDVTLGAVTALWGFSGEEPRLPAEADLKAALATAGLDNVVFSGDTVTLKNGAKPDLGAVGKGAALDAAAAVLKGQKVSAVVSFGGSVLLFGQKPGGGSWTVGVRDPKGDEASYFATLAFALQADEAVFVSTSGSYEKTFTENGKTYHHILDPKTGYPVENDLVSVTAVASDGFLSDALSTALFVLGPGDRADALCKKYLTGAVFVYKDGTVSVTDGLADAFGLTEDAPYRLREPEAAA